MRPVSIVLLLGVWACKGDTPPVVADCPSVGDIHPAPDEDGIRYASVCPTPGDGSLQFYFLNGEPVDSLHDAIASAPSGSVLTMCNVQSSIPLEVVGGGGCPIDIVIEGTGDAAFQTAPNSSTVIIEDATVEFVGVTLYGLGSDAFNALRVRDSEVTLRNSSIPRGEAEQNAGIDAQNSSIAILESELLAGVRAVDSSVDIVGSQLLEQVVLDRGELAITATDIESLVQVDSGYAVIRDLVVSDGGHFDVTDLTMSNVTFSDSYGVITLVDASNVDIEDVTIDCPDQFRRGLDLYGGTVRNTTITGCAEGVRAGSEVVLEDVSISGAEIGVGVTLFGTLTCAGTTSITDVERGFDADGGAIVGCSVDGAAVGAKLAGDGGALVDVEITGSTEAAVLFDQGETTIERALIQDNHVSREAPLLAPRDGDFFTNPDVAVTIIDSDVIDNSTTDTSERASGGILLNYDSAVTSQNTQWANGTDVVITTNSDIYPAYEAYVVGGVANFSCTSGANGSCVY